MNRGRLFAVVLAVAVLAAVPALASSQSPPRSVTIVRVQQPTGLSAHTASLVVVPKFVFHTGLAFGAFHHFIYLPFKAGKFTNGSSFSKLKTYVFAGGAALFVYHETKLALADAQQNKVLKVLVTPLTAVVTLFNSVVSKVKAHNLDTSTVTSAQSAVTSLESMSKSTGSSITEAVPTATQIVAGSA